MPSHVVWKLIFALGMIPWDAHAQRDGHVRERDHCSCIIKPELATRPQRDKRTQEAADTRRRYLNMTRAHAQTGKPRKNSRKQ